MQTDVLIIGGGIAGLSAAAWLSEHVDVVVVEAEDMLGYHTTGRSAALYTECYGDGPVRRLTIASREFLTSGEGLTAPRPVLFVGAPGDDVAVRQLYDEFSSLVPTVELVDAARVAELCDAFEPDGTSGGVYEPLAMEIDVAALQSLYTRTARDRGTVILTGARVQSIERIGSLWVVEAGEHRIEAPVVVDAAGAWGDVVAEMAGIPPLDLRPLLRSVFVTKLPRSPAGWPFVVDAHERWYFKPEGPNLLGTAASELPSFPCDARPPELDVALGIERINAATTLEIRSVLSAWAGLRTFTPDRVPAVGFDPDHEGFFWLVGQGGYGIMTSPALGELSASLIVSGTVPDRMGEIGVNADSLAPGRFRA